MSSLHARPEFLRWALRYRRKGRVVRLWIDWYQRDPFASRIIKLVLLHVENDDRHAL